MPETTGSTISVVVPHYQNPEQLDLCLQALGRQTLAPFEIIVSDNNSPMGVFALERVIAGRARLTTVTEKGAGPARNGGVEVARGAILAFTDCDCIPEAGWLQEGLNALDQFDFVGGKMTVLVEDPAHLTGSEAFERVFAFDNETYVLRKNFTVTANLFCSRALFQNVGGFRTEVSEDLEWSHRAIAAGYKIGYASNAVVGHPARRSWPDLKKKWQRLNAEQFAFLREQPRGALTFLARACAMPFSAFAHTPKVLLSPDLHTFGERLKALRILYQLRFWRTADSIRLLASSAAS